MFEDFQIISFIIFIYPGLLLGFFINKRKRFIMEVSSDYMLPQRLQIQTLGPASKLLGMLSKRGLEYWCFRSRSSRSKGMPSRKILLPKDKLMISFWRYSLASQCSGFERCMWTLRCLHAIHEIFSQYVTIPLDPWLVTQRYSPSHDNSCFPLSFYNKG